MSKSTDKTTFIITNFNTSNLIKDCLESLLDCYKKASVLIIDNGSDNIRYLEYVATHYQSVSCLFNSSNITHGSAMHQAAYVCQTPFLFFLDSDCVVQKHGFLKRMIKQRAYAVGNIQLVNESGINVPNNYNNAIRYVHPSAMLIDRNHYLMLPKFIAHGAPCIENMIQANLLDLLLVDWPIAEYVQHLGRGTRDKLSVRWNGEDK